MKREYLKLRLQLAGGLAVLVGGLTGPCLRWYDQKAHYMGMPSVYEQLSWFAFGGAFAVIGAWLAFRLRPWWLYTAVVVLFIGAYIGFLRHAEAVDSARLTDFLLRNMSR
jgi:hypothetical protein